jgi:hypothetical protein
MSTPGAFNTTAPSGSDSHWKVAGTTAPQLLLSSSRDARSHASIYNDAQGSLYITFGGGAVNALSVTGTFDVKLTSGSYYELPKPIWTGEIWGIWDTAGGWARIFSVGID